MASTRKGATEMRARCIEMRETRKQEAVTAALEAEKIWRPDADAEIDKICAFLYDVVAPLGSERDVYIQIPTKFTEFAGVDNYFISSLNAEGYRASRFMRSDPDLCAYYLKNGDFWECVGNRWVIKSGAGWGEKNTRHQQILKIENTWAT